MGRAAFVRDTPHGALYRLTPPMDGQAHVLLTDAHPHVQGWALVASTRTGRPRMAYDDVPAVLYWTDQPRQDVLLDCGYALEVQP